MTNKSFLCSKKPSRHCTCTVSRETDGSRRNSYNGWDEKIHLIKVRMGVGFFEVLMLALSRGEGKEGSHQK